MRGYRSWLSRLERRMPSWNCVDAPIVFLLAGRDFPEDAPPEHARCDRCGEWHDAFDGHGRRIVLLEDESGDA